MRVAASGEEDVEVRQRERREAGRQKGVEAKRHRGTGYRAPSGNGGKSQHPGHRGTGAREAERQRGRKAERQRGSEHRRATEPNPGIQGTGARGHGHRGTGAPGHRAPPGYVAKFRRSLIE